MQHTYQIKLSLSSCSSVPAVSPAICKNKYFFFNVSNWKIGVLLYCAAYHRYLSTLEVTCSLLPYQTAFREKTEWAWELDFGMTKCSQLSLLFACVCYTLGTPHFWERIKAECELSSARRKPLPMALPSSWPQALGCRAGCATLWAAGSQWQESLTTKQE